MPQAVPRAAQVGQALMARGQQAMPGDADDQGGPEELEPSSVDLTEGRALRLAGAQRTGGAGQVDDHPMDDGQGHSPNAVNIAVGEALTRLGGGAKSNPNPHKDRAGHLRQLMQLGLSQTEAELMVATGGV